jgi:hypothetical protein
MKKLKNRIYIQQWLELKPYDKQVSTDLYYLKISNEVKLAILSCKHSQLIARYLDEDDVDIVSCFLTSYLEDIISGTNLWNAYVRHHAELYQKPLPFFNCQEYYEDEINQQDVAFLLWYYLNIVRQDLFISPVNEFIDEIAGVVFEVLDSAWDDAPGNKVLKAFYTLDEEETNYYKARTFIDNILFSSYLFYPDAGLELAVHEQGILEKKWGDENLLSFLNENRDNLLHETHTRLLSLTGKEWASKVLGENHPRYHDLLNISQKIRGYFLYKGQDQKSVFIEHISSGRVFELSKKSFEHYSTLQRIDTILFMGIVMWMDEWWFSGVFFTTEFNADLVLNERSSLMSRMAVSFLDHQEQNVGEILEKQLTAFKSFTKGHQIVFIESAKIDEFAKKYTEHYNDLLGSSEKEKKQARQRARSEGYMGEKEKERELTYDSESGLVFFNPKSGVEIAFAVNSAFPLPNNSFFKIEESDEHVKRLLMNEDISAELVMFCIDHCKDKLSFFNTDEGKVLLKDLDFLMRFWKKDKYYSKPAITFTGIQRQN